MSDLMGRARHTTLGFVLRAAAKNRLEPGWIYFASAEQLQFDTPCLFVPDVLMEFNEGGSPHVAAREGFAVEGLDTATIRQTVECLLHQGIELTESALVQSFVYYLKYDAFLPRLDAPPPPPLDEIIRRLDQEFFDALGDERVGTVCKTSGCTRGRVSQSVFCRVHHFESVKRKACPFTD